MADMSMYDFPKLFDAFSHHRMAIDFFEAGFLYSAQVHALACFDLLGRARIAVRDTGLYGREVANG